MIRNTIRLSLIVALLAGAGLAQDGLDPNVEGRNATLKRAFTPLSERLAPHVVAVLKGRTVKGFGVVVPGGVLTSAQVVTATGTYTLRGHDGQEHTSQVLARSAKEDLALLNPVAGLRPIALGSTAAMEIGQYVLCPSPQGTPLAVGVLSAKDRRVQRSLMQKNVLLGLFMDGNDGHTRSYDRVIQHDGLLESEHLGGPVVNSAGKLVGINVALPFRGSAHAIPVEVIKTQLASWVDHAVVEEGPAAEGPVEQTAPAKPDPAPAPVGRIYVGLNADDAPLEKVPPTHKHGIAVLGVTADSPAAKAGLKAGDVILELDGKRLESLDHLGSLLNEHDPGQKVVLKIMREQRMTQVELVLEGR